MVVDPLVASLVGTVVIGLLGLVAWFARAKVERQDRDVTEEGHARAALIQKLRDDFDLERERDRRENLDARLAMGSELSMLSNRFQIFQLEVAKDCINSERLANALAPMSEALAEIKTSVGLLFQKLDGKQDKRVAGDD